ncbi:MAG: DUF1838 family protein [Proteobacteria bacterium]|nr:DUF1838 family protein [Pseudomonadota bacterium]
MKLNREVGLYTDLRSCKVLETWHNRFLDEKVKVVPIANDPFNFVITEFAQGDPMDAGRTSERRPLILPWRQRGGLLELQERVHYSHPNHLTPDKWVRESSGPMIYASEMTTTFIDPADMQNPSVTGLPWHGSWVRKTPWLPWMLMGLAPGHCLYTCTIGSGQDLEAVHSRPVLDYVTKHYRNYFEAPIEWDGKKNRTSLENYVLEQKPTPPK